MLSPPVSPVSPASFVRLTKPVPASLWRYWSWPFVDQVETKRSIQPSPSKSSPAAPPARLRKSMPAFAATFSNFGNSSSPAK